jgi:hypothetical protein
MKQTLRPLSCATSNGALRRHPLAAAALGLALAIAPAIGFAGDNSGTPGSTGAGTGNSGGGGVDLYGTHVGSNWQTEANVGVRVSL